MLAEREVLSQHDIVHLYQVIDLLHQDRPALLRVLYGLVVLGYLLLSQPCLHLSEGRTVLRLPCIALACRFPHRSVQLLEAYTIIIIIVFSLQSTSLLLTQRVVLEYRLLRHALLLPPA